MPHHQDNPGWCAGRSAGRWAGRRLAGMGQSCKPAGYATDPTSGPPPPQFAACQWRAKMFQVSTAKFLKSLAFSEESSTTTGFYAISPKRLPKSLRQQPYSCNETEESTKETKRPPKRLHGGDSNYMEVAHMNVAHMNVGYVTRNPSRPETPK